MRLSPLTCQSSPGYPRLSTNSAGLRLRNNSGFVAKSGAIPWKVDDRMPNRPCRVEISTRALEDNYRFLRAACDGNGLSAAQAVELLAIVKADAYGHGIGICAPAVVRAGARWLGEAADRSSP